jgi:glycosyltransferase involved in cell wall biosynthesis
VRILLACAAFPPFVKGGGAVTSFLHAKALARVGHDVRCLSVQGDDDRLEEYEGVKVHRLPSLNMYWNYYEPRPAWKKAVWHCLENFNPIAFAAVRREIKNFRPDLVVTISTENVNVASWAAARAENVPVAHCAHSFFLLCWRGSMFRAGRNCSSQCHRCVLTSLGKKALSQLVHGFYAETEYVLSVHRAHRYFKNAVFGKIPAAIDGLHSRPARAGSNRLRIGYIGVHTREKGLETLARAAQLCVGRNVEFLIAGAENSYSACLRTTFPPSNTRFFGWVKPSEFFAQVDAIVVPSIWREPFGRVVIEAFSYGIPVIGSTVGGLPESILDDVNGYLFPPNDAARLADILGRLADRATLARLCEGAKKSAVLYEEKTIGTALANFYEETVAHARALAR